MKWSQTHLFTFKEAPNDAEIASHQLMVRAGLIKKLGPGLYTFGTFALRSLRKFEAIIREELEKAQCQEVLMPMVHPRELWEETGRWSEMGDGLLKFKNRNDQWFCLGATHEEVITDYVRNDIKSYRHLPHTLYQIQTKYRDEVRPRFGLMRCREFIMKDAYSFDRTEEDAHKSYDRLFQAYQNIFDRLGVKYRHVMADSGNIGGNKSQEFQGIAEAGEDALMICDSCEYAANVEIAPSISKKETYQGEFSELEKFDTPGFRSIADLAKGTGVAEKYLVKTMFLKDEEEKAYCILLRGDDEVNDVKVKSLLGLKNPPEMLTEAEVKELTSASPGSCGPIGLDIPVIIDEALENYSQFMVGANEDDKHFRGVSFPRDFKVDKIGDVKLAKQGDQCPNCAEGKYQNVRGIEVGHCFYLGKKYAEKLNANFLDENGKSQIIEMGCYGIGVSRTIQAVIEQSHDDNGIVWPRNLAPFDVHICNLDPKKEEVSSVVDSLVRDLQAKGFEVFEDDRKERPGVKFKDADLIGLPVRIVVGGKGVANAELEVVDRKTLEKSVVKIADIPTFVEKLLS